MKEEVEGSKYLLSFPKTDHWVMAGLESRVFHSKRWPFSFILRPRWREYQSLRTPGLGDLKKIPPIPVTRFGFSARAAETVLRVQNPRQKASESAKTLRMITPFLLGRSSCVWPPPCQRSVACALS